MRSLIGGAAGGDGGDGDDDVISLLVFLAVAIISLFLLLFHFYVFCFLRAAATVGLDPRCRLLPRDGEEEGVALDLPEDHCVVCLSSLGADSGAAVRVLPRCRHVFHASCIGRWLSSHSVQCPLCRTPARAAPPPPSPAAGESSGGDCLAFMESHLPVMLY